MQEKVLAQLEWGRPERPQSEKESGNRIGQIA